VPDSSDEDEDSSDEDSSDEDSSDKDSPDEDDDPAEEVEEDADKVIRTSNPPPDSHLESPALIRTAWNPTRPDSNHESPPTPLIRATRTPALIRALKPT
jgi:hypothetical protein